MRKPTKAASGASRHPRSTRSTQAFSIAYRPIRSRKALAILPFLLVAGVALASEAKSSDGPQWPSFRGPNADGTLLDTTLPTVWNVETGENVAWRTELPGLSHSSPIVWGDRVFVTSAIAANEAELKVGLYGDIGAAPDEGEVRWTLTALDLAGEILWTKTLHQGEPKIKRHTKASHANSTPATNGEVVVSMLGSEGLHAFTVDGEHLWSKDLGVLDSGFFLVPTAQWGFASSPVIHRDRVIVQADVQGQSFLAAFSLRDGSELWRTNREEVPTWSSPTIAPRGDSHQVIVNGWKHIGGYAIEDGRELWKMAGGGDIPTPTPIVWKDLVLITSAHGQERPIYAVRLDATGDIEDTDAVLWEHERAGNYMQTPIIVGDIAYFCMDNGLLSAYQLPSGEQLYKTRLGGGQSGFTASPVATSEALYFPSEDGDVYIVRPGKEFELIGVQEVGETVMATPAIAGDLLLVRGKRHLSAFREKDTE